MKPAIEDLVRRIWPYTTPFAGNRGARGVTWGELVSLIGSWERDWVETLQVDTSFDRYMAIAMKSPAEYRSLYDEHALKEMAFKAVRDGVTLGLIEKIDHGLEGYAYRTTQRMALLRHKP